MRRTMTTVRPASPSWGSRFILYGAFALILASGYALYVQLDTSKTWLTAIINSNRATGIIFNYCTDIFTIYFVQAFVVNM